MYRSIHNTPFPEVNTADYLAIANAGSNVPETVGLWALRVALLTCSDKNGISSPRLTFLS